MRIIIPLLLAFSCLMPGAFAQNRSVTGKVTDAASGQPLSGVSIVVKGSKTGTTTDARHQKESNNNPDYQADSR